MKRDDATEKYVPSVAMLCAMYNEEDVAEEKIQNFKTLSYPNIRLYVGSDGSTDGTNEILSSYSDAGDLSFFLFPRRGKVHVINDLISAASEEIFVFTDANSMYSPTAVDNLLVHFKNPQIGAVCGCLKLIDAAGKSGEGFYWRYETAIKRAESAFGCVIGANGGIYAVRSCLVQKLPTDTINDDFTLSMGAIAQGYGMTYAEDAIATEEIGKDDAVEFKRHVRDAAGHYRAMRFLAQLLNPFYLKTFFLYVSHRVIRWFVPHLMLVSLVLPFFNLSSLFAKLSLTLQAVFYGLVLMGGLSRSKRKIIYIPYYFVYINLAMLIGFTKNLLGLQSVTWNRTQRS